MLHEWCWGAALGVQLTDRQYSVEIMLCVCM